MEQNINQDVMDKITKVCLCKAISRARIKAAINEGSRTVEEVKRATGAGSGGCRGKRCTSKVEELLRLHEEKEF